MATDAEESDTDDHERPAPPKRQCTRLLNVNENAYENERSEEAEKGASESEESESDECEYDEAEKIARQKLFIWQEYQVAKGFLDNTINRVMENYILNPPVTYLVDDPPSRLFRGTDMEDTAVMMAIRNHGLVHSTDMVSQSQAFCANGIFDRCLSDERADNILLPFAANRLPASSDLSTLSLPSSSTIFDPSKSTDIDRRVTTDSIEDEKMDESDREQDFLERAVAEAIKKKGLSALSVDYG